MDEASHFIDPLRRIDRFRIYVPRGRRDEVRETFLRRWKG